MRALEQRPLLWQNLTWEEIACLRRSGVDLCLLPAGATEQHGPQLGTGMDTCTAVKLCEAVSRETGVPVLPALSYGCSLGHSRRWPGTIALQPQTIMNTVVEIYDWLYGAGFKRLIIVNGHVGNAAPLRCAVDLIRSRFDDAFIRACNIPEISPRIRAEFFADAEDWHANAAETSLMLAVATEQVRADKIAASDDEDRTAGLVFTHPVNRTSLNGVTGFPSRASREQGEKLFSFMVEDLTALVRRALKEQPPLAQSYFTTLA
ncbi:MAG: creatininase family protein [Verrucomicrobiales bacterium]|nr:creatininase family protein [Verrucomicrobiales bacterium]